jgi:pyruvate/2-oxoglutarate/acetoin dehydrogenase E1 component
MMGNGKMNREMNSHERIQFKHIIIDAKGTADMTQKSLEAAEQLGKHDIHVEVVDLRTTLPIDEEAILNSVGKTGRLVTVAEACAPCSVASEVAALVMERGFDLLKAPLRRVHAKFAPVPFAKTMEDHLLPQTEDIVAAVRDVLE